MSSHKLHRVDKSHDHERVFLAHYDWLLDWAYQLTHNSKEEAEDLVQDLYIRFVQSGSTLDLSDEDRLRGYLYRTIKRLFISRRRRHGRSAISSLLVVDFDSLEYALAGVDRSKLLLVRSDLARVCEYARIRRRTHRGASALILRFFLGYLPSEIAKVLQTNRAAVDRFTSAARAEARVFLSKPGSLRFMDGEPVEKRRVSQHLPEDPAQLFVELKRRIFTDASGECLAPDQLESLYANASENRITTLTLAHLVSCTNCLERANKVLGLPGLEQRFPSDDHADHSGNEPPTHSGDGDRSRKLRRKFKEVFEHRPTKLQMAVNGEVRGVQAITATHSKFEIRLEALAQIEFLEVLSEQGVSLLYHAFEDFDPMEPSEQEACVSLSDGRTLSVALSLDDGTPTVEISYYDPLVDEAAFEEIETVAAFADAVGPIRLTPQISRWDRLCEWFKKADWGFFRSVSVAAGIVTLIAFLSLVFGVRQSHRAPESARDVLQRSAAKEQAAIPAGGAVHQVFSLEVRSAQGAVVTTGRVDVLSGRAPHRRSIRFLNPAGKTIRGTWQDGAGKESRFPIHHELRRSPGAARAADAWLHVPDAADFSLLTASEGNLSVERTKSNYQVSYVRAPQTRGDGIASAKLLLTSAEMRPYSESFVIEEGGQREEYRFEQLSYEVLPANRVVESDFEMDPRLLGSVQPSVPNLAGPSLAHIALQAFQLLNNLGPEIEGDVDVERMADGPIQFSGVLPTKDQERMLLNVLAPLRKDSRVALELHSNEDAAPERTSPGAVKVEAYEPVSAKDDQVPFDGNIRTALEQRGLSGSELDDQVHQFERESIRRASRVHREAWMIRQLGAADFSAEEIQSLSSEDRMLWLTLLDKHIRAMSSELDPLVEAFDGLRSSATIKQRGPSNASQPPQDVHQLAATVERLGSGAERLDRLLATGLAVSPRSSPTTHNLADIVELLAALRTEESVLHQTVARLQAADPDGTR